MLAGAKKSVGLTHRSSEESDGDLSPEKIAIRRHKSKHGKEYLYHIIFITYKWLFIFFYRQKF